MMVDKMKWSWTQAQKVPPGELLFLFIGALVGALIMGLPFVLIGAPIALAFGLVAGLINEQIEETTYPGQHLKQTLFNAAFSMLIGGLSVGLVLLGLGGLMGQQIIGLPIGESIVRLILWLVGVLFGALFLGLINAGKPLLQHFVLRFVLARYGLLPKRLIPFLEYAVDLIFLRRAGGSYIFVHRLLMEHFAEMDV